MPSYPGKSRRPCRLFTILESLQHDAREGLAKKRTEAAIHLASSPGDVEVKALWSRVHRVNRAQLIPLRKTAPCIGQGLDVCHASKTERQAPNRGKCTDDRHCDHHRPPKFVHFIRALL